MNCVIALNEFKSRRQSVEFITLSTAGFNRNIRDHSRDSALIRDKIADEKIVGEGAEKPYAWIGLSQKLIALFEGGPMSSFIPPDTRGHWCFATEAMSKFNAWRSAKIRGASKN